MTEKIARQVVLVARPHGRPKPSDFRLEETAIPTPASGSSCSGFSTFRSTPICAAGWDDPEVLRKAAPDSARS